MQNVITTTTDRDFVDVTVKPSRLGKALAGVALAAAATLTTTFHHPFYDITQSAFVEAVDLKTGDQVQTATAAPPPSPTSTPTTSRPPPTT